MQLRQSISLESTEKPSFQANELELRLFLSLSLSLSPSLSLSLSISLSLSTRQAVECFPAIRSWINCVFMPNSPSGSAGRHGGRDEGWGGGRVQHASLPYVATKGSGFQNENFPFSTKLSTDWIVEVPPVCVCNPSCGRFIKKPCSKNTRFNLYINRPALQI